MSLKEENTQFMLRWYNEVWNNSNEDLIDEMFHPECSALGLGDEPVIGSDGFKEVYRFLMPITKIFTSMCTRYLSTATTRLPFAPSPLIISQPMPRLNFPAHP
jgi:hypothetical protein